MPGGVRQARNLYDSGQKYVDEIIRPLNLWSSGDAVLDIGCANGRLAMQLVNDGIIYHGIDIVDKCLDFCKTAFADYADFHFHHSDIRNGRYNKDGSLDPLDFAIPLPDRSIDVILASSLFTHLGAMEVSRHYLDEIVRVSAINARFYSTWFTSPPHEENDSEDMTVYKRAEIIQTISQFFDIERAWGGLDNTAHHQMKVVGWKI